MLQATAAGRVTAPALAQSPLEGTTLPVSSIPRGLWQSSGAQQQARATYLPWTSGL